MNLINFKLIWRNLLKNANISIINIIGLSVSLAICILIVLFLQFEYSFDKSNPGHNDIYRLLTTFKYPNSPESQTAEASPMMGPYFERESGDVEKYLRISTNRENFLCKANNKEVTIGKSIQADSTFFSFFDFPLLYGNKIAAFQNPDNILLTRKVSEQLFGEGNPVGKIMDYTYSKGVEGDTTVQFVISAVFDDLPKNSHLQFDALTWLDDRIFDQHSEGERWHGVSTITYLKCRPNTVASELTAELPKILEKEMPGHDMIALNLQSFSDIHLGSMQLDYDANNFQKSDWKYMKILGLVAVFILLISSINFANLSTVLALRRVKEVGVRKSLGASKNNVLWQFLDEAVMLSVIGGMLALFWVELLRKPFLSLIGREIELTVSPIILFGFIGAVILLGLLAGLFPALKAKRYSAVEAFQKKGTSLSVKRPFVQRLVVLQFVLAGMLIIGSIVSQHQLNFMKTKDLGFNYNQIIELDLGYSNSVRAEAIKKELGALPNIIEVSGSDVSLGAVDDQQGLLVQTEEKAEFENFPMSINRVNHNFFDLYEMEFLAGQSPSIEGEESEKEYVVNESFIKLVGWKEDPIGKYLVRAMPGLTENDIGRVVGVIKDIHHNTLHHQIEPICFQVSDISPIVSLKVHSSDMHQVLRQAQKVWNGHIKRIDLSLINSWMSILLNYILLSSGLEDCFS